MTLQTLAQAVRSNFKTLQEGEIIGRIMLFSGKNFSRSLTGYKLLIEQKLIPNEFIEKKTRGLLFKMLDQNPVITSLFDQLDVMPGKMTWMTQEQRWNIKFEPPARLTDEVIAARLQHADLDF